MNLNEHSPRTMLNALIRGSQSDLRDACGFADRIVEAVERAGDVEELKEEFHAFRARNDYEEDDTSQPGHIYFYPLSGEDVCAPPKEITQLGRFNAPFHPVLYLSTSREVAIAETRTLSTDLHRGGVRNRASHPACKAAEKKWISTGRFVERGSG